MYKYPSSSPPPPVRPNTSDDAPVSHPGTATKFLWNGGASKWSFLINAAFRIWRKRFFAFAPCPSQLDSSNSSRMWICSRASRRSPPPHSFCLLPLWRGVSLRSPKGLTVSLCSSVEWKSPGGSVSPLASSSSYGLSPSFAVHLSKLARGGILSYASILFPRFRPDPNI